MWRRDTSIVMNHIMNRIMNRTIIVVVLVVVRVIDNVLVVVRVVDNCAGPDLGIHAEPVNIGGNLIANIV